jgi:quercetin dioxygenase-like cupin family protein
MNARRAELEMAAVAVPPGEGTTIEGPAGGPLTFKVRGEQTNGSLTALENVIAPGDGPPLHVHANEDEAWYVLEGELRFRLDEQLAAAPAGTFVFVPRGTAHCFQNAGDTPARILVLFTPSGMERFFDRFAAQPPGAVDPRAFASIGGEVGMDVVGPPLAQLAP